YLINHIAMLELSEGANAHCVVAMVGVDGHTQL
ncbi:unnamed protein product, partial [marine sediment metagenome]